MADNLATFILPIVLKFGCLKLLEPSGSVQACNGIALPFVLYKLLVFGESQIQFCYVQRNKWSTFLTSLLMKRIF